MFKGGKVKGPQLASMRQTELHITKQKELSWLGMCGEGQQVTLCLKYLQMQCPDNSF